MQCLLRRYKMKLKRTLLQLTFILASLQVCAQAKVYQFNTQCATAYHEIMKLNIAASKPILEQELKEHAQNLMPVFVEEYTYFLEQMFNGTKKSLAQYHTHQASSISQWEAGPKDSPWYKYGLANFHFHSSLILLRNGDYYSAAMRFRKSIQYLQSNYKQYPNFKENKLLLGVEKAIAGTIPESYQWIASLLGVKGDINEGMALLAEYLNEHPKGDALLQDEAIILYTYLSFYLQGKQERAWQYINSHAFEEEDNLLRNFVKANLGLNYRKAAAAKEILSNSLENKYLKQYPIFYYELAEALIASDETKALKYYIDFLENDKAGHFVKDAYLKIAWIYYLQGNNKLAQQFLNEIKKHGKSLSDADKQALKFAEQAQWPLAALLEVRLKIDAGYYTEALQKIKTIPKTQLHTLVQVLDYNFRYARIFEELKEYKKAFLFYDACIREGALSSTYYAARSYLQKGQIYERLNQKEEALTQYKKCLELKQHDMQNAIDQMAKAGINRLE